MSSEPVAPSNASAPDEGLPVSVKIRERLAAARYDVRGIEDACTAAESRRDERAAIVP